MILRRVIEHFRKQEWTAIFLDFVIVVVGVFVAAQVSNWNADRLTAARQEALLVDLADDLRSDLEEIDVTLQFTALRFNAAQTILARTTGWRMSGEYPANYNERAPLPAPPADTPKTAEVALYFVQRYTGFNMERRTFEALIASGDFTFAKRPGLAAKLRSHYTAAGKWTSTEVNRQAVVAARLREAFGRHGVSVLEDLDWEGLEAIVNSDPALIGELKATDWEAVLQYNFLNEIRDRTNALLAEIERKP